MKFNQSLLIVLCACLAMASCKTKTVKPEEKIEKVTVVINNHEYHYDAVSGATVADKNWDSIPMTNEEKLSKMFWSPKPAVGFIKGDFYHGEKEFDEKHIALIDVVKDGDKIVHIEMEEVNPADYYSPEWASATKRYSGYAFFQVNGRKTEKTFVTLINGLTFLEYQMLQANSLVGDFKSVKGASNSITRAFLPAAAELNEQLKQPSGKYYYGLVKDLGNGIIARLEVILEGDKIWKVRYDEIFDDTEDQIADANFKQFYRQSKYHSLSYPKVTGSDFKGFADKINAAVVASQDILKLTDDIEKDAQFKTELETYKALAAELAPQMK